jgi:hypothetical protein
VAVYFPAVVNHGHLAGQALFAVDTRKFVRRGNRAPIHRHNDVTRFYPKLAHDAALWHFLDKYPTAWVPRKAASNLGILLRLIVLDLRSLPWGILGNAAHRRRNGRRTCRLDDGGRRGPKRGSGCGLIGRLPVRQDPPTDDRTHRK